MEQMELPLARAARDEGMSQVEANSHEEWKADVDKAIVLHARSGDSFTSDDIRHFVHVFGHRAEPHHDNAWGARFAAAAKRGEIVKVGHRQSARKAGHARTIAVWRGVGR